MHASPKATAAIPNALVCQLIFYPKGVLFLRSKKWKDFLFQNVIKQKKRPDIKTLLTFMLSLKLQITCHIHNC
jgi:hypothetical protein